VLCRFDSHYEGVFLFDRNRHWVIYSQHSPIATGCTLVAFDLKTKQQVWETHLKGIGPVGHSKWRNRINLKLTKDSVTVYGDEATQKYIESVSLESGELIYHRLAQTDPRLKRAQKIVADWSEFIEGYGHAEKEAEEITRRFSLHIIRN